MAQCTSTAHYVKCPSLHLKWQSYFSVCRIIVYTCRGHMVFWYQRCFYKKCFIQVFHIQSVHIFHPSVSPLWHGYFANLFKRKIVKKLLQFFSVKKYNRDNNILHIPECIMCIQFRKNNTHDHKSFLYYAFFVLFHTNAVKAVFFVNIFIGYRLS